MWEQVAVAQSAGASVSKQGQAQVQSETGSRQKAGTDRRSGSRQAPFYAV